MELMVVTKDTSRCGKSASVLAAVAAALCLAIGPAGAQPAGADLDTVRAGRFEIPEGKSRSRNIVIEFPTYQAALDCWKSPEYQEALKLRVPVSTIDLVIIEGYDGPQPS